MTPSQFTRYRYDTGATNPTEDLLDGLYEFFCNLNGGELACLLELMDLTDAKRAEIIEAWMEEDGEAVSKDMNGRRYYYAYDPEGVKEYERVYLFASIPLNRINK